MPKELRWKEVKAPEPVHQDHDDGYWYFWDETWGDRYGPYSSEDQAKAMLSYYEQYLSTGAMTKDFVMSDVEKSK